jgi:hypothetical protein
MPGVGFNTWFPLKCDLKFVIKNITKDKGKGKTVRVFGVPIRPNEFYNLMNIPIVSEADILHSLQKGTLLNKICTDEVRVTDSDINLLSFNECQKEFLMNAGIEKGVDPGSDGYASVNYLFRQNVRLLGVTNGSNRIFTIPFGEKFINGNLDDNEFRIIIDHNGRRIIQNIDYVISESEGPGTGFDTIRLISFTPRSKSKLIADYVVHRD